MDDTITHIVEDIAGKLVVVKSQHSTKNQNALIDIIIDVDIDKAQRLLKQCKSLSLKKIKQVL